MFRQKIIVYLNVFSSRSSGFNVKGVTLLELVIVVGMLVVVSAVAASAIRWIDSLLVLPSPYPALGAVNVVRGIYDAAPGGIVSVNCSLNITTSQGSFAFLPDNRIACYEYADSTVRIYGNRTPGSCTSVARQQIASGEQAGLRLCEYEEQVVISQVTTGS